MHVASLVLLVATPPAWPCSTRAPEMLEIVPDPSDTEPPGAIVGGVHVDVGRGVGPDCSGPYTSTTSCDDIGLVSLRFLAPRDGADGYVVRLVEGEAPMVLDERPFAAAPGDGRDGIALYWLDGSTYEQEPLDFVLAITPVDLAGNEGSATLVRVTDPGHDDEGSCTPPEFDPWGCGEGSAGILGVLAWARAATRRRARWQAPPPSRCPGAPARR